MCLLYPFVQFEVLITLVVQKRREGRCLAYVSVRLFTSLGSCDISMFAAIIDSDSLANFIVEQSDRSIVPICVSSLCVPERRSW